MFLKVSYSYQNHKIDKIKMNKPLLIVSTVIYLKHTIIIFYSLVSGLGNSEIIAHILCASAQIY